MNYSGTCLAISGLNSDNPPWAQHQPSKERRR